MIVTFALFSTFVANQVQQTSAQVTRAAVNTPIMDNYLDYQNFGIEIKHPASWHLVSANNNTAFRVINFVSPFNSVLNIVTENLDQNNITLNNYVQAGINQLENSTFHTTTPLIERGTLAGNPSEELSYNITVGRDPYPHFVRQLITIDEGKAYVITYNSDNKLDTIPGLVMINSFKIQSMNIMP
jgi:hypothetical protein